jgi:hypothetical protein
MCALERSTAWAHWPGVFTLSPVSTGAFRTKIQCFCNFCNFGPGRPGADRQTAAHLVDFRLDSCKAPVSMCVLGRPTAWAHWPGVYALSPVSTGACGTEIQRFWNFLKFHACRPRADRQSAARLVNSRLDSCKHLCPCVFWYGRPHGRIGQACIRCPR